MVLDAVLADPDVVWLGAERDKVAHFTRLHEPSGRGHAAADLSQSQWRGRRALLPGPAPDRLPSGWSRAGLPVSGAGRDPFEFRLFLQRTARCSVRWPSGGFACSCPHISRAPSSRMRSRAGTSSRPRSSRINSRSCAGISSGGARSATPRRRFRRGALPASPRDVLQPRYRALYKQWIELGCFSTFRDLHRPWRGSRTPQRTGGLSCSRASRYRISRPWSARPEPAG